MKRKYRVLALTDHTRHSDQNSIYALLNQFLRHECCASMHAASRGLELNNTFFQGLQGKTLFGTEVTSRFKYSKDGIHFKKNIKKLKPEDFDIVLMRLPRPVTDEFLVWVKNIFGHAVMINDPIGILKTSNKKYLLNFQELCPPIFIHSNVEDIIEMAYRYPIVLKPLKEYGGKGILKIEGSRLDDGAQIHTTEKYLKTIERDILSGNYLTMKFLKNVDQGDKRIIVVDGEIIASSLRLPAEDSWLCNVSQGGISENADVTPEEMEMVKVVSEKIAIQGVFMYGMDTLVDDDGKRVLSEINTLSIGGLMQAENDAGFPVMVEIVDKMIRYADRNG